MLLSTGLYYFQGLKKQIKSNDPLHETRAKKRYIGLFQDEEQSTWVPPYTWHDIIWQTSTLEVREEGRD